MTPDRNAIDVAIVDDKLNIWDDSTTTPQYSQIDPTPNPSDQGHVGHDQTQA